MAWPGRSYTYRLRDYLREQARSMPPRLAFGAWRGEVAEWRSELRAELRGLLGLERMGAAPLDVRVLDETDCADYARVKISFTVVDGLSALAYVLIPAATETLIPGVVCLPDVGRSKESLVGLHGDARDDPDLDYALALCRRGTVSVALDLSGSGERADAIAELAPAAAALGLPLMGLWVWEAMRAVEYISGRMEVRPERVGLTGLGRGAEVALLAAALDERVYCTVGSGWLGSYRQALVASDCVAAPPWRLAGLVPVADIADIACLVAPRNLRLQIGRDDRSFLEASARQCAREVVAGFEAMGDRFRVEAEVHEGGHLYHGQGAFPFLEEWLKLPLQ
jgi:hypothetical protein